MEQPDIYNAYKYVAGVLGICYSTNQLLTPEGCVLQTLAEFEIVEIMMTRGGTSTC